MQKHLNNCPLPSHLILVPSPLQYGPSPRIYIIYAYYCCCFFHTQYSSGSLNVMYFLWPLCFSYIWVWLVYIYIMTKDVPSPLANRKTYLCTIVRIMSCPDMLNTQIELLKWLIAFFNSYFLHIFKCQKWYMMQFTFIDGSWN